MRVFTLFLVLVAITSCGRRGAKQAMLKEESIRLEYLQKGGKIVELSQAELLKNVSNALNKGGPGYAVEFCNIRAMPLMDSLSRLNNCQIKRIALKYRNPEDMPKSDAEEKQLNQYLSVYQKNESIEPEVYLFNDRIEYYHPIMINMEACLKCHGDPGKQISGETLEKIKSLYPNDLATGFKLNDFRGSWKITFLVE